MFIYVSTQMWLNIRAVLKQSKLLKNQTFSHCKFLNLLFLLNVFIEIFKFAPYVRRQAKENIKKIKFEILWLRNLKYSIY